jgi:hypothetical protein
MTLKNKFKVEWSVKNAVVSPACTKSSAQSAFGRPSAANRENGIEHVSLLGLLQHSLLARDACAGREGAIGLPEQAGQLQQQGAQERGDYEAEPKGTGMSTFSVSILAGVQPGACDVMLLTRGSG